LSLSVLSARLEKVENQRRSGQIAAVLARVRQCPPADMGARLVAELTALDQATQIAIMDQLTTAEGEMLDVELEALFGPDTMSHLATLTVDELDALARRDPAAERQFKRALRSLQHQGDVCP
jgi:hypothetical protein